jgi:hypothetical protein
MPRFKLKGVLERDALADWWRHTLTKIPTAFGRLLYMASLRDTRSGVYHHHGLSSTYGRDESKRALTESHQQVFAEWLSMPLPEKVAELRSFLAAAVDEDPRAVIAHWRHSGQSRSQFPVTATHAEREMFCLELDILLQALEGEFMTVPVASGHGPGSSPLA